MFSNFKLTKVSVIDKLVRLLPSTIFILVILGFLLTFAINRFDYAIKGLVIAIPLICASVLVRKILINDYISVISTPHFHLNRKIGLLLWGLFYILSIDSLMVSNTRPWYYFLLLSALYILIFFEIFSKRVSSYLVLVQIIGIMLNFIYSVLFKYPYYFGGTDLMVHIFLSNVTYSSGHIIPESLDFGYSFFPLYHIFVAEVSNIVGLDIRTSLFLISGLVYPVIVIFLFYVFKFVTFDDKTSLLACVLFSANPTVLYFGTDFLPRSMAFVGFIMLLYCMLIPSNKNQVKYKFFILLFLLYILLVHQVSSFLISFIMLVLFVSERVYIRKRHFNINFYVLFNTMILFYCIYISYLYTHLLLAKQLKTQLHEDPSLLTVMNVHDEWLYLSKSIHISIFLFFILIGIIYLLRKETNYSSVFGFFSLLTLPLYVPNPILVLQQTFGALGFERFMLLVSPFVALVMGYGILIFYSYMNKIKFRGRSIIIILLFTLFTFNSLACSIADSNNLWFTPDPVYFNGAELQGFKFISENIDNGSCLYSDYISGRFFCQREVEFSKLLGLPFYKSFTINNISDLPKYEGYIIINQNMFLTHGLHFGEDNKYSYKYSPKNIHLLSNYTQEYNKIYSNNNIFLFKSINYTL